jgi:hypothetical protein
LPWDCPVYSLVFLPGWAVVARREGPRVARWYMCIRKRYTFGALEWKTLVHFMIICVLLWPFGKFYGHLIYLMAVWYIFRRFGQLYQENLAILAAYSKSATAVALARCFADCVLVAAGSGFSSLSLRRSSNACWNLFERGCHCR